MKQNLKQNTDTKNSTTGMAPRNRKKSLVIVESPAKARTIKKYLGHDFIVKASIGHIKDLPTTRLGVDIEHGFEPQYEVIKNKEKIIAHIVEAARQAGKIYLAPDPDREGEAIAWHIAEEIKNKDRIIYRAIFHEVTKAAVLRAIEHPGSLNRDLFEAQQARRVLDRLVGYQISPLLWKNVRRGLSAGRVQSVAVRLICEREREIATFVAKEYWTIDATVEATEPPPFNLRLTAIDKKKANVTNESSAQAIVRDVEGEPFVVGNVERKTVKRNPAPPFITSTLQQEAARKLRFSAKKTMLVAQRLYEGVGLGELGAVGLITYMRTDSTRVSDEAVKQVRAYIEKTYSTEHLPKTPNIYKSKKTAQEAHEAIRPTSLDLHPEVVKSHLDKDLFRLYHLIWNRFVASQMSPAVYDQTKIDVEVKKKYLFSATGQVLEFSGFLTIYEEGTDDQSSPDSSSEKEEKKRLPAVTEGQQLRLIGLHPKQNFTQPPPRFTESSLIKELERRGIGRPSTYAVIVSTIQEKEYVRQDSGIFKPTELGTLVTDMLIKNFPEVMDIKFTALMEDQLDKVEEGSVNWVELLHNFYRLFRQRLDEARYSMRNLKQEFTATQIKCEKCGANMIIRWGKKGRFLACPNYPKCRNTKEYVSDENGEIRIVQSEETDTLCEKCGRRMVIKVGRKGRFLACPGYPQCRNSKPLTLGIACPMPNCSGELIERQSKKGKTFYACNRYPACKFILWEMPVNQECPKCHSPFLLQKQRNNRRIIKCYRDDCDFVQIEQADD
jgi:DNA topoisomerase-1